MTLEPTATPAPTVLPTTAHRVGIPTTSTMMCGHVDEPRHWVAHLELLRAIQVKMGLDRAVEILQGGVNDLGGTLMEETISRMAGSTHGIRQDPEALQPVATAAGRPVAERDTLYRHLAPNGPRRTAAWSDDAVPFRT